jgi:hypothetical protein
MRVTLKIFCLTALMFSQCECDDSINKKEELPAITQTGANTFGCLVNEKLWLPKGNYGTANLDVSYDPTYEGGSLDVSAYRITGDVDQFMVLGGINISTTGQYNLSIVENSPGALFKDHLTGCSYIEPQDRVSGSFTISRLDLENAIISGTFEFTLAKAGCDTIRVTQGRFDMRI